MILLDEILDHLARRLSTLTFIVRRMRADGKIFKRVEFVTAKVILQLPMNDIDIFQRKITSANTGLIGHNEKLKAQLLENLQGFHGIGKIFDIFNPREVVLIQNDGPVSVEKDGFPRFNLLSLR